MVLNGDIQSLKKTYVAAAHTLRQAVRRSGGGLDPVSPAAHRYRAWFGSLLAIHDVDELNRLDLAWWQLDAQVAVDAFLRKREQPSVFEYGSGASTLWLARRAHRVTSIEHDAQWHKVIKSRLLAYPNVKLRFVPPDGDTQRDEHYASAKPNARGDTFSAYVQAINDEGGEFDLIVIDGRCRSRCMEIAPLYLKSDGLIIFDNSGRKRYRASIAASGLSRRRYRGLTACLPYPDETTLLSRG